MVGLCGLFATSAAGVAVSDYFAETPEDILNKHGYSSQDLGELAPTVDTYIINTNNPLTFLQQLTFTFIDRFLDPRREYTIWDDIESKYDDFYGQRSGAYTIGPKPWRNKCYIQLHHDDTALLATGRYKTPDGKVYNIFKNFEPDLIRLAVFLHEWRHCWNAEDMAGTSDIDARLREIDSDIFTVQALKELKEKDLREMIIQWRLLKAFSEFFTEDHKGLRGFGWKHNSSLSLFWMSDEEKRKTYENLQDNIKRTLRVAIEIKIKNMEEPMETLEDFYNLIISLEQEINNGEHQFAIYSGDIKNDFKKSAPYMKTYIGMVKSAVEKLLENQVEPKAQSSNIGMDSPQYT